jgi:hypothetical protein
MTFQHTIIQICIYIYTYNVQWDPETSYKTYINLSPHFYVLYLDELEIFHHLCIVDIF